MKALILLGLFGVINGQLLGGWHHCNSQVPQAAVEFAKKSLMKMNMDSSNFAVDEHHVMCQVVAGMNYKFSASAGDADSASTCSFNVYVDLNNHAHLNEPVKCIAKKQLGGFHPCNAQLPQAAVDFAKKSLMKMNMDSTNFAVDEHHVMCQVVAGMNYKFSATAGDINAASTCSFNIYVDLNNHAHLNEPVKCSAKRQIGMPGGVTHIDTDDQDLQGAINAASKSVNMMSNSMNHMTVVGVTHATKQVVRGMKYSFDIGFKVADTCRNTEEHFYSTLVECPPAKDAATLSNDLINSQNVLTRIPQNGQKPELNSIALSLMLLGKHPDTLPGVIKETKIPNDAFAKTENKALTYVLFWSSEQNSVASINSRKVYALDGRGVTVYGGFRGK